MDKEKELLRDLVLGLRIQNNKLKAERIQLKDKLKRCEDGPIKSDK